MKKTLVIIVAAILVLFASQQAKAVATWDITITISITTSVSVDLDVDTWDLSGSSFSSSYISGAYTVTNDGSVNEQLKVIGANSAGPNTWTLAGAAGTNQFKVQALIGADGAGVPVIGNFGNDGVDVINSGAYELATAANLGEATWNATSGADVAPAAARDLFLAFSTPTGGYSSSIGNILVTVSANAL